MRTMYILGAGASYGALPLANELERSIGVFIQYSENFFSMLSQPVEKDLKITNEDIKQFLDDL